MLPTALPIKTTITNLHWVTSHSTSYDLEYIDRRGRNALDPWTQLPTELRIFILKYHPGGE